MEQVQPN